MLAQARVHPTLPAADLARPRQFYEGVLGLAPSRIMPGCVFYGFAEGTDLFIFPSSGKASGDHTQVGFRVSDIEAEVADLKRRGVAFETYGFDGFEPATSIASFPANRSAWFKDSEGNLLGVVQMLETP